MAVRCGKPAYCSHVEVEIVKLVAFGAFGRLENGVEGLIHVSELASERVQRPEDVLKVGDKVNAKVISISAAIDVSV